MKTNIKPQREWYNNDPDALIIYLYWLESSLPENRDYAKKQLAEQLNKKFPCPEHLRAKWGLKDEKTTR